MSYANYDEFLDSLTPEERVAALVKKQEVDNEKLNKAKELEALGYGGIYLGMKGMDCIVWSNMRQQVYDFKPSEMGSSTLYQTVFGTKYIDLLYTDWKGKVDIKKASYDLISKSENAGFFNDDDRCGNGCWPDHNDKKRLIVNSKTLFDNYGNQLERAVPGRTLYENEGGFGVEFDTPEITDVDLEKVVTAAKHWEWERSFDYKLFLGWLVQGFYGARMKWRTNIKINGPAGSGKSYLCKLVDSLFGSSVLVTASDTTEAAIRASLGRSSRLVVIDEDSNDERNDKKMEGLKRNSASGTNIKKSSAEQKVKTYKIYSAFMSASIRSQVVGEADASRTEILKINRMNSDKLRSHNVELVHNIDRNLDENRRIGASFQKMLVNRYALFVDVLDMLNALLLKKGRNARFSIVYSNLMAGYWIVENNHLPTESEIESYLNTFDLSDAITRNEVSKDENSLINSIFDHILDNNRTVYEIALSAARSYKKSSKCMSVQAEQLARYGLLAKRTDDNKLAILIDPAQKNIRPFFRGTEFERTDLREYLSGKHEKASFKLNGKTVRGFQITTEIDVLEDGEQPMLLAEDSLDNLLQ